MLVEERTVTVIRRMGCKLKSTKHYKTDGKNKVTTITTIETKPNGNKVETSITYTNKGDDKTHVTVKKTIIKGNKAIH